MAPDAVYNVVSAELARVCDNAHAFLPARSRVPHARLSLAELSVSITSTDGYAVGYDFCEAEPIAESFDSHAVPRDTLRDLARAARADKKGTGRLEVYAGDGIAFTDTDGNRTVLPIQAHEHEAAWKVVDSLFSVLEGRVPTLPQTVLVDPNLLMRFSHVKCAKEQRHADFRITGPDDPILVKVGPTFRGIILPVSRETDERNHGSDGHWAA